MTGSQFPPYLRFTDGSYLTLDGNGDWGFFNAAGVEQFTIKSATGAIASASVAYASLAASALPKQGAVVTSDFTMTAASTADVTGATVTTNGPALIIVQAQMVTSIGQTTGILYINASAGNLYGSWFSYQQENTFSDLILFGSQFSPPESTIGSPNDTTGDKTYNMMFLGYCSAAATVKLQAASDGTRTLTVKIGSFVASSI